MKYLLRTQNPHFVTTPKLNNIKDDEWEKIAIDKQTYQCYSESPSLDNLLYPGFFFSSEEAANQYGNTVMKYYINKLRAFTTPRGNLSKGNNIIFIGQRPGHYGAHLSTAESAWLLGPSSKMLIRLCLELGIYPYFTNFYHSHNTEINNDWSSIYKEILSISVIYHQLYDIHKLRFVFLGNYPEYNIFIKDGLKGICSNFLTDMKFEIIKIWHPAYLVRSYTDEKYYQWVNNLEKQLK